MARPVEPLLPLLRSRVQGDLLALLYLNPDEEFLLSRIATYLHVPLRTVQRESERLVRTNLARQRRVGSARLVRAATDSPLARPLTDILALTYGPMPVLTEALRDVSGIEHAFIYGSWAARYQGEYGRIPNDVDVLVVGDANRNELFEIATDAGEVLRREVNIHRIPPSEWDDTENPSGLVRSIRERPLVELRLNDTKEEPE